MDHRSPVIVQRSAVAGVRHTHTWRDVEFSQSCSQLAAEPKPHLKVCVFFTSVIAVISVVHNQLVLLSPVQWYNSRLKKKRKVLINEWVRESWSSAGCHTVRRLLEGCKGLQEAGWADVSCENWLSSLVTPTVHRRRCRSSRSVREKFCRERSVCVFWGGVNGEKKQNKQTTAPQQNKNCPKTLCTTDLVTAIALVRLLSAVHSLVSVQMVALNESHVTRIASIWLLSCGPVTWREHYSTLQFRISRDIYLKCLLTRVCEYMPFEVVAASERPVAVVTDKVLLDFQRTIIVHVDGWK